MQATVISDPRGGGSVQGPPVCRARVSAATHRAVALRCSRFPHGKQSSPAIRLENTYNAKPRRPKHQQSRPQACQQTAATPAATPLPLTIGPWQSLLSACKLLAVLLCMPLVLEAFARGSQQWCLLALAGVILPLQSKRAQQSMQQWKHITQAAATVETETEEQADEPEAEEPNDNTILESGAELGNVQTPASVWLPYSTGQNGKVLDLTISISRNPPWQIPDASMAVLYCMHHIPDMYSIKLLCTLHSMPGPGDHLRVNRH